MKKNTVTATFKTLFGAIALLISCFSINQAYASEDLRGWTKSGKNVNRYRTGFEEVETQNGPKEVAFIKARKGNRMTYTTLMKSIDVEKHRGKRIQMLTKIKTKRADNAAAWVKIDGKEKTLSMDNMANRRLNGNSKWTDVSIVLDIPEDAQSLTFGFLLRGKGNAWFDSPKLQFVGQEIATTNPKFDTNGKPLDFNQNQIVQYLRNFEEVADVDKPDKGIKGG